MSTNPRVLIAGAGWRVSAFVVPALLSLGLSRSDITILRRRLAKPEGVLAGIHAVDSIKGLSASYALTINCVARGALVDVQCKLVDLFPDAVHFCDTPIFDRLVDLPKVARLAKVRNLFSLEDWPKMPNLEPMLDLCARSPGNFHLRFEHIGAATHFLAAARAAAAGLDTKRVVTRKARVLTVKHASASSICVHKGPKDFARSKIAISNGTRLIEDFFEVRDGGEVDREISSGETICRRVEGNKLRYCIEGDSFREVEIPEEIIALFLSQGTRNAVHELDKCVALMDIFRNALDGQTVAYGYFQSVKDAISTRLVRSVLRVAWAV